MANPLHDGPQFSGEQRELGKSFPTRAPKAVVSTNTPWHLWDSPWSCLMSRHPLLSWSCCSGVSLSGSNQCSNSFIHHLPRLQTLSPNNRIFSYWKRASYKLYVHPFGPLPAPSSGNQRSTSVLKKTCWFQMFFKLILIFPLSAST